MVLVQTTSICTWSSCKLERHRGGLTGGRGMQREGAHRWAELQGSPKPSGGDGPRGPASPTLNPTLPGNLQVFCHPHADILWI